MRWHVHQLFHQLRHTKHGALRDVVLGNIDSLLSHRDVEDLQDIHASLATLVLDVHCVASLVLGGLLVPSHLLLELRRKRCRGVVESLGNDHAHGLPLVLQPRAEPPLSPPHGGSTDAFNIGHDANRQGLTRIRNKKRATLRETTCCCCFRREHKGTKLMSTKSWPIECN